MSLEKYIRDIQGFSKGRNYVKDITPLLKPCSALKKSLDLGRGEYQIESIW
jgi:hypothetical protein